jgi:hypothetical protein
MNPLTVLFKQVHIPVSIQFPEKRIGQVIDKLDGLPVLFISGPGVYPRLETYQKRRPDLDRIAIELFLKIEILSLWVPNMTLVAILRYGILYALAINGSFVMHAGSLQ